MDQGPCVDWRAKVDLFEQLRREHEFGIGTIAGVAAKFGVHRRGVCQAVRSALPPRHHYPSRSKPKLGAVAAFIDKVLDEDRHAPRKQRHTARRLYRRILTEFPDATVAESTVRNHVRERKHQMGLLRRETFVPQSYGWAQEAQVDWYEAWIDLGDERTKVQVFAMRSMASGAAFHRAYLHATQQAFLEAHEHAFAYFGGVFLLLRYDNLASAVRKVLRGHRREEAVRFMAFRSHWRFAAEFCTPGEGHEKGGVEGGYFRRNHLVPVPQVADLDALNSLLLTGWDTAGECFIVREHTHHPRLASRGNWRGCGRTDTGTVREQEIALEGFARPWRCIELMLDAPTEDGDMTIRLWTNLPAHLSAAQVAELYRRRWRIEGMFQRLESVRHSEIGSLGQPRAALLGFAVALLAYNVLALIGRCVEQAHHQPPQPPPEVSLFHLALT